MAYNPPIDLYSNPQSIMSSSPSGAPTNLADTNTTAALSHHHHPPLHPRFSHLPTPHSPDVNSMQDYVNASVHSPESPLAHMNRTPQFAVPSPLGDPFQNKLRDPLLSGMVMMTPDSSPVAPRAAVPSNHNFSMPVSSFGMERTPPNQIAHLPGTTPQPSTSTRMLDSPISMGPARDSPSVSALSSPFMPRLEISPDRRAGSKTPRQSPVDSSSPPTPSMILSEDAFAQVADVSRKSTPPVLPLPVAAGGELDRINQARQRAREEQIHQQRETEHRRPEYLKRSKRTLAEADPTAAYDDDRERVGILDSPQKGRRIKLFQETSEESFEESLMAGGYGRYRTAEWVRQPQPLVAAPKPVTPVDRDPSPPPPISSEPPSEKELVKRKRLAAFMGETGLFGPVSRLYPIDIPGRGRTLVDHATEEATNLEKKKVNATATATAVVHPTGTAATNRKGKKKDSNSAPSKRSSVPNGLANEAMDVNWPDASFPWSVRAEEHAENANLEEAERLGFLERFFERDSDGSDSESSDDSDEEIMPSTQFGELYEDDADRPLPPRRGRGKMIGLPANPDAHYSSSSSSVRPRFAKKVNALFPSDPADARAALMAKKSARSLHYRRKRPEQPLDDEEIVCVCSGQDDGTELVQCDSCQTWFHLHCIGISGANELGNENDLWYCEACAAQRSRGSTPEADFQDTSSIIPMFVKSDDAPHRPARATDASLFQTLAPPSPMPPWVSRQKPGRGRLSGVGVVDGDRLDIPWAPRTPGYGGGNFSTLYGGIDTLDLPATPSHQKQIAVPSVFQTPKNGATTSKVQANTQMKTPRNSKKMLGAPGSLPAVLDDGTNFLLSPRHMLLEDSPTRRSRPSTSSLFETPRGILTPRYLGHYPVDESPISRAKGKERAVEYE